MSMQRLSLYTLIVKMHPATFRYEFGNDMLLDFSEALQSHGLLRLYGDSLLSLGRQWVVFVMSGAGRQRPGGSRSLLAGDYADIAEGGLGATELARGLLLPLLLLFLWSALSSRSWPVAKSCGAYVATLFLRSSQATTAPLQSSRPVVIHDIAIVDVKDGILEPHKTVLIEGGRIRAVWATNVEKHWPADSDELDGHGKFLIPALWDMHTHITNPARDFPMYIANGVLGLRNMGGVQDQVFAWKRDTADGSLFGPRMLVSGPIVDGPNGSAPSISVVVANATEARREVDTLKARGADFIKVYDALSRESYFAIADESRKIGLPFAGHVPVLITIREATDAGQRTIEHAIELRGGSTAEQDVIDIQRKRDIMAEAMHTQNFALIPEFIAQNGNLLLDHFSQPRADALYRSFVRNGTYLCPTLDVKQWLAFVDDLAKQPSPRQQYVPKSTLHYWQPEVGLLTRYRTPAYIAFRKREYAAIMQQIPRQQAAGVQLLAGTDLTVPFTYAGFSVHDEMELFVKAGLSPLQALQTATTHPVEFFGLQQSMGSIVPGKVAELVVLDANPLQDIRNAGRITAVVTHGRILRRADLDSLLSEAAASAQASN